MTPGSVVRHMRARAAAVRRDLRRKGPAFRQQVAPWAVLFVGNLAVAAVAFAAFEGISPFVGLWWAVVSGTTTGYGDVLPHHVGGYVVGGYALLSSLLIDRIFSAKLVAVMVEEPNLYSDGEQERDEAGAALQLDLVVRLCAAVGVDPSTSPMWDNYRAALDRVAAEEHQKESA